MQHRQHLQHFHHHYPPTAPLLNEEATTLWQEQWPLISDCPSTSVHILIDHWTEIQELTFLLWIWSETS